MQQVQKAKESQKSRAFAHSCNCLQCFLLLINSGLGLPFGVLSLKDVRIIFTRIIVLISTRSELADLQLGKNPSCIKLGFPVCHCLPKLRFSRLLTQGKRTEVQEGRAHISEVQMSWALERHCIPLLSFEIF